MKDMKKFKFMSQKREKLEFMIPPGNGGGRRMIITKENDSQIETYRLVETDDGWYWQVETKPYWVADIKRGITRPFKSKQAAMKAVGKKIVTWKEGE